MIDLLLTYPDDPTGKAPYLVHVEALPPENTVVDLGDFGRYVVDHLVLEVSTNPGTYGQYVAVLKHAERNGS